MPPRILVRAVTLFVVCYFCVACQPQAQAEFLITGLPTENRGGFRHNVFHSASGVTNGQILGWYDLDTTRTSTWDPSDGDLDLWVIIYDSASLNNPIGTAHGTSSDLKGANFGGPGYVLGTIEWTINLDETSNDFWDHLTSSSITQLDADTWKTTMTYTDKIWATSAMGYRANTWEHNATTDEVALTLWGADGYSYGHTYNNNPQLGTDLVATLAPVPAPSSFVLAGIGFGVIGCVAGWRRYRSAYAQLEAS